MWTESYYFGKIARQIPLGGPFAGHYYNEVNDRRSFVMSITELMLKRDSYAWSRIFVMLHKGFIVGLKNGGVVKITDKQCPEKIESGNSKTKINARFIGEYNGATQISLNDILWEVSDTIDGSKVFLEPAYGGIQDGYRRPLKMRSLKEIRWVTLGHTIWLVVIVSIILAVISGVNNMC